MMKTKKELIAIGCKRWSSDCDLMLFPLSYFDSIPLGTEITWMDGDATKFTGNEDKDTLHGILAFGVVPE